MRSSICERPTCKPRYAEFSCRLAKIAQTAQNKRETGNVIFAMATLIRVKAAVRRDFFKSLLHFCKFLVNPSSISKLTTSSENQRTDTLTLYFSYGNIVNFSRTSRIHLYLKKNYSKRHSKQCAAKNAKNLPFPCGTWTPYNTPIPRPTPLTTPNDCVIDSRNFAQLRNKFPFAYNGMPHIYPQNCPFLRHPDPVSRFARVHPSDRETDRPTDGLGDRSVPRPAYALRAAAAGRTILDGSISSTWTPLCKVADGDACVVASQRPVLASTMSSMTPCRRYVMQHSQSCSHSLSQMFCAIPPPEFHRYSACGRAMT